MAQGGSKYYKGPKELVVLRSNEERNRLTYVAFDGRRGDRGGGSPIAKFRPVSAAPSHSPAAPLALVKGNTQQEAA